MVEYSYYEESFKGKLDKEEFEDIEAKACDVVKAYIMGFISINDIKYIDKLDLKNAICYQVDFMDTIGKNVINGDKSQQDLKSISTSGFNYSYKDNDKYDYVGNVPISSMTSVLVKQELRVKGFLNLIYNQCIHHDF